MNVWSRTRRVCLGRWPDTRMDSLTGRGHVTYWLWLR